MCIPFYSLTFCSQKRNCRENRKEARRLQTAYLSTLSNEIACPKSPLQQTLSKNRHQFIHHVTNSTMASCVSAPSYEPPVYVTFLHTIPRFDFHFHLTDDPQFDPESVAYLEVENAPLYRSFPRSILAFLGSRWMGDSGCRILHSSTYYCLRLSRLQMLLQLGIESRMASRAESGRSSMLSRFVRRIGGDRSRRGDLRRRSSTKRRQRCHRRREID